MKFVIFLALSLMATQSIQASEFGCTVNKIQQSPWQIVESVQLSVRDPGHYGDGTVPNERGYVGKIGKISFIVSFGEEFFLQVSNETSLISLTHFSAIALPEKKAKGFYRIEGELYQVLCE